MNACAWLFSLRLKVLFGIENKRRTLKLTYVRERKIKTDHPVVHKPPVIIDSQYYTVTLMLRAGIHGHKKISQAGGTAGW